MYYRSIELSTNAYNAQLIGMLQLYTSVVRTLYKPSSLKPDCNTHCVLTVLPGIQENNQVSQGVLALLQEKTISEDHFWGVHIPKHPSRCPLRN